MLLPWRVCKGLNKKYRNLFYDTGLEAVLAKAGHVCVVVFSLAGFRFGGLRGPVAVLEQKERLNLRDVVAKSREPRQGRRGDGTKEPFAESSIFAVLQ
jgi:hypothetical protein